MKFQKLFILLAAAGSGALVFKIRHPDDGLGDMAQYAQNDSGQQQQQREPQQQDDPNPYTTLTGEGSLFSTLRQAKQTRDQNIEQPAMHQSYGGITGGGNRNGGGGGNGGGSEFSGGIGKVTSTGKSKFGGNTYGSYGNNNTGSTTPSEDLALLQAAAKGDKLGVARRIAAGVKIDSRDTERRTPLMYAATNGFEDIIDRLVAAGANPNFKDRNGNNAFDYAAGRGLVETVQYLLERTHSKDDRHYIEYAQTIRATYAADISLLPPGDGKLSTVNRITPDGQAPLHIAAGNGSVDMINALIKRGAEINLTNSNQQTPLHWAAWNNQPGSAEALLQHGACVFQGEAAGNTPLMLAAQSNSREVAKVLLDNGAEKDVVNKQGKTAAMQAEDRGFRDLSDTLK